VSVDNPHRDRFLASTSLCVLGAGLVLGAALGASRLGLYVPPSGPGALAEAMTILGNNLRVLALVIAASLLQPRGIPGLSPGFLPLWLTDLAVGVFVVANLVALGGVLGALGLDALVRVIPHAPFEVGGYLIAIVAYLRTRDGLLDRNAVIARFFLAAALLICGAFVESYVSGALA
jgi:stage II sporulation SpoM-like protein